MSQITKGYSMALKNQKPKTSANTSGNYAIIVAGGTGSRMLSAVPKQFLLLNGKPVIMHTVEAFYKCHSQPHIILVLHTGFHQYWEQLCNEYNFTIPVTLIKGGETRFHSVKNGLNLIPDDINSVIAIHDAVRPLASPEIIDEAYRYAFEHGNAIVAVKSRDSVRQLWNDHSVALKREDIYLIQTPQTFRGDLLKEAYQVDFDDNFTDDASVVERAGTTINMFNGSYQNIKITFPEDIAIAEAILNKKPPVS
jgi:2-C-methyl-D-erythritol 4-phosphate cytidylyltransferase